jgi:hypothetical protein
VVSDDSARKRLRGDTCRSTAVLSKVKLTAGARVVVSDDAARKEIGETPADQTAVFSRVKAGRKS